MKVILITEWALAIMFALMGDLLLGFMFFVWAYMIYLVLDLCGSRQ